MKKRTAALVISLLCALSIVLGVFAKIELENNTALKRAVGVSYQRAFGELVASVSAVDTSLQKSLYAVSPSMAGAICTEVFGKAMTAQMALGALPFATAETEQVAGFINRVGDYSYMLSRKAASGKDFGDEEKNNLKSLSDTASILAMNLTQLQTDMASGKLTMDELSDIEKRLSQTGAEGASQTLGGGLKLIEQEFPEVPALVYDGPFSEHLSNPEAVMIRDELPVDESAARLAAAKFLGVKESLVYSSGSGGGDIACYYFGAELDDKTYTIGVTEKGAKIASMTCLLSPAEARLTAEEAVGKAKSFLEQRGYQSMKDSYHMLQGGILTANFAYEQEGVICYSDLIKVCVAMDTGKICGFEARGYLLNHKWRELSWPAVDRDTARLGVPSGLEIISENTALIPTAGKYEILCHEFVCKTEDESKIILYVNAETGIQEKLLILLEDESGSLTI